MTKSAGFLRFIFHLDHRSHLHRHQEISPEELDGLEATLKLINTLAKHVYHSVLKYYIVLGRSID